MRAKRAVTFQNVAKPSSWLSCVRAPKTTSKRRQGLLWLKHIDGESIVVHINQGSKKASI